MNLKGTSSIPIHNIKSFNVHDWYDLARYYDLPNFALEWLWDDCPYNLRFAISKNQNLSIAFIEKHKKQIVFGILHSNKNLSQKTRKYCEFEFLKLYLYGQ